MTAIPAKLQARLDDFQSITDRNERAEYLIELADNFPQVKVPDAIASEPYDEGNRVPACESEAFVWAQDQPDGTLRFYFDVLNPQGLSARAVAVVLDEATQGASLEEVASIPTDLVYTMFGNGISMGKGQGLMGLVNMVRYEAQQRLRQRQN